MGIWGIFAVEMSVSCRLFWTRFLRVSWSYVEVLSLKMYIYIDFILPLGMGHGHRNCVVVGCSNSGKRLNKWASQTCELHGCLKGTQDCSCEPPFKLFPFPTIRKDSAGRRRWTANMKREVKKGKPWIPNSHSRVCSAHFRDGKPTEENPDPTENLGYESTPKTGSKRKPPAERFELIAKKKARKSSEAFAEAPLNIQESIGSATSCSFELLSNNVDNTVTSGNCAESCAEIENTEGEICENSEVQEELRLLKEQLHTTQSELQHQKKIGKSGLRFSHLKKDKEIHLLTGIPSKEAFTALFTMVSDNVYKLKYWTGPLKSTKKGRNFKKSPKKFGPRRELKKIDEFLLTMMKLRLGSTNADLGQRFGISATTVTNVFTTWIKVLSRELGFLIYNPSFEVFRKTLPRKFQKPGYSKVRHIIDCTEIFIETPSDPVTRAATWSDYKHHNTAKILVSITPNGAFNFVSKAWGGRTSDVHLTRESGFYDILERYDEVMADRGFTISEDLLLHHARLHIPPGKRGQEQFSRAEVKKTKEIANLRIYVEQAIRRLKTFRLIKHELPISLLENIDDIVIVCAAICNLYKPLCK